MKCQGYKYFNNILFECQNIVEEKLCEDCLDSKLEQCMILKGHYRCANKINNKTKICNDCVKIYY